MSARCTNAVFVVVSGLPASGKTTLASQLSVRLGISLLDKDAILEALYDGCGCDDEQTRGRLSRASDLVLQRLATAACDAVLVSHWRHPAIDEISGTPTEWLATLPGRVVEVHVACAVDVAVRRFLERRRHPGHLDKLRGEEELRRQCMQLYERGPLGIGALVTVRGDAPYDIDAIMREISKLLST